jgi:hypothetical protein
MPLSDGIRCGRITGLEIRPKSESAVDSEDSACRSPVICLEICAVADSTRALEAPVPTRAEYAGVCFAADFGPGRGKGLVAEASADGDALAALSTAAAEHGGSALGLHAGPKAVGLDALAAVRLKRALRHGNALLNPNFRVIAERELCSETLKPILCNETFKRILIALRRRFRMGGEACLSGKT